MTKALHDVIFASDGRQVELIISVPLITGNIINLKINDVSISPVTFTGTSVNTLSLFVSELILNERVQEVVAGTNKVTVTGLGANIEFTDFTVTGGASQPTTSQNELVEGSSKVTPLPDFLKDEGYKHNDAGNGNKPADGHFNWLIKNVGLLHQAIKDGEIGGLGQVLQTIDELEALTADSESKFFYVKGYGLYQWRDTEDTADRELIVEPADSVGRFCMALPDIDAIFAYIDDLEVAVGELDETLAPVVVNLNFPSMTLNAQQELTATVPGIGLEAGYKYTVELDLPSSLESGLLIQPRITNVNEVTIRAIKATVGTVDPAAADYTIITKRYAI